jgi:hypothetical protein
MSDGRQWWRSASDFAELLLVNFIWGFYEIGIRTATTAPRRRDDIGVAFVSNRRQLLI